MLVAQSCLTLCNTMDCSPPGSCVHEIFQARILDWVAISLSRGSSWPRNWTRVSCIADRFFTGWTTREAHIQSTSCEMPGWRKESEKAGLKFNIQKTKIMASSSITSWQMGQKWKQWQTLFYWALKSLQMVTEAIKLEDTCFLEEKLWQI